MSSMRMEREQGRGAGTVDGFLEDVIAQGFDWFVTLYFPSPIRNCHDPKLLSFWRFAPLTEEGRAALSQRTARASKCVRNWMGEIMLHAGTPDYHYLMLVEPRRDRAYLYHILLGGCSGAGLMDRDWKSRWKVMSGGYAYDRVLDDRTQGLLKYLIMMVGCRVEIGVPGSTRSYNKGNFHP
jgi:hypothetical protein